MKSKFYILLAAIALSSTAFATIVQPHIVSVQCVGKKIETSSNLFLANEYSLGKDGALLLRGNTISLSNAETTYRSNGDEVTYEVGERIILFNSFPCDKKTVVIKSNSPEMVVTCGAGSSINFSPTLRATYEYSVAQNKLYRFQEEIKNLQIATFSACDRFHDPH